MFGDSIDNGYKSACPPIALNEPGAPVDQPPHYIVPSAVPPTGLRLQRRYKLGRRVDGLPILWAQRESQPLLGPPESGLRFDVLEEAPL